MSFLAMGRRSRPSSRSAILAATILTSAFLGGATASAATLTYTLSGGTMSGSFTLGGTTTNVTNAAVTFSVTANSSSVVTATSSNSGVPLYYLLVGSATMTLTEGSNTYTLSVGTQNITYANVSAPAQMAVVSYYSPTGGPYSGIGFGLIDVVSNVDNPSNSPTTPYFVSAAQGLAGGTAVYTNLQTTGSFASINFIPLGGLEVSNGAQSGTLTVTSAAGAATMTISAASAVPGGSGVIACVAGVFARRRRR